MHGIKAITLNGTDVVLEPAVIETFRADLRGKLLTAADAGYDSARRLWNAMIDKRPALIVRCEGAADVSKAVRFAATHELLVSVRGGGHNVAEPLFVTVDL
jgi:FAD/FMN-containing dehydrogenase